MDRGRDLRRCSRAGEKSGPQKAVCGACRSMCTGADKRRFVGKWRRRFGCEALWHTDVRMAVDAQQSDEQDTVPGELRLLFEWLTRPVRLRQRLEASGTFEASTTFSRLWRAADAGDSAAGQLARRSLALLFAGPVLVVPVIVVLGIWGVQSSPGALWSSAFVLTCSLVFGLLVCAVSAAGFSVMCALGVLSYHLTRGAITEGWEPETALILGLQTGAVFGLLAGSMVSFRWGAPVSIRAIQLLTLIFGAGVAAEWFVRGVQTTSAAIGLTTTAALLVFSLRLPLYPLEACWQLTCFVLQRLTGRCTLGACPVRFHELTMLPLPLLRAHLLASAKQFPAQVAETLGACQRSQAHAPLFWEHLELAVPELEPALPPKDPASGRYACDCCGYATVKDLLDPQQCQICGWLPTDPDEASLSLQPALVAVRRRFLEACALPGALPPPLRRPTADEPRLVHHRLVGRTVEEVPAAQGKGSGEWRE